MRKWDSEGRKASNTGFIDERVTSVGTWGPVPLGNPLVNHVGHIIPLEEGEVGSFIFEVSFCIGWGLRSKVTKLIPVWVATVGGKSNSTVVGEMPHREEKHRSLRWKFDNRLGIVSIYSFRCAHDSWEGMGKGINRVYFKDLECQGQAFSSFFLTTPCDMWNLTSLTRDWSCALCIESATS